VGCGDDDDDDAPTVGDTPDPDVGDDPVDQVQDPVDDPVDEPADDPVDEPADDPVDEPDEPAEDPVVAAKTRGGTIRFTTPAATHDYFDPHRAVFGPTQSWMGSYMSYLIRWRNK
jgi:hypothetical protein